jgi:hypothetical protein
VEISTTAPSNYQGTAWKDANNNRYIGCFLTDSSSNILNEQRVGNSVRFKSNNTLSPFQILSGGSATTSTSISCSGCIPPTSTVGLFRVYFQTGGNGNYSVYFGTSNGTLPSGTASENLMSGNSGYGAVGYESFEELNLNSSQAFLYICSNSGCLVYIGCLGYREDR